MEINHLRYILKIAQYGSFSRAADELYVSQPALSQQINKLEQELGISLFHRTTRFVALTSAGEDFVKYAKEILDSWDELNNVILSHIALERGRIVVGLLPTIGHLNLTHYIAEFLKIYSNIRIKTVEAWSEELMDKLLTSEIDVAFLKPDLPTEDLKQVECYTLLEDHVMLVTSYSNSLADKNSVSMKELADAPVLMLQGNTNMARTMHKEFKLQNINPPIVCECSNTDTLISMVSEGMGISFLTSKVAKKYKGAKIKIIPIYPTIKSVTALVLVKSKPHSPTTLAFKNFIIKHYAMEKEGTNI